MGVDGERRLQVFQVGHQIDIYKIVRVFQV
jgi:hypothetical protein